MATGANLQPGRGNQTTALAPSINLDTGEAEAWGALRRLGAEISESQRPEMRRRAEAAGIEEGRALAAGEIEAPRRLLGGELAAARTAAVSRSYLASVSMDLDAREAEIRRQHSHDPEAYDRAMGEVASSFIQNAAPDFAVDVETYALQRRAAGREAVAAAAGAVAMEESRVELATRQGSLTSRLVDMARGGQTQTIDFQLLADERRQLIKERLNNPAIAYTQAQADADEREYVALARAGVATRFAVETLREDGPTAALGTLQEILTDPDLDETQRQTAFQAARAAVNQEIGLATDRQNIAQAARTRAEQEINRRIEDDAAAVEIGAPGTGLTEAEVSAVLGPSGVAEWYRKRAEAAERNRLTGDLAGLPIDEAMTRARQALSGTRGTVADLSEPLKTPTDFDALAAAVRMVETGNNPARISEAGAIGAMQLLPDTARAMAELEGVPYSRDRLLNDAEYNQRLGRRYLQTLLDKYDGNQMLAVSAYHAGPALVDAWLQPRGTTTSVRLGRRTVQAAGRGDPRTGQISVAAWLDSIAEGNSRSAAYPRKVAEALGAGRQSAEWLDSQANRVATNATSGFASDPLNFAAQHRIAPLPALPVDAVFAGGDAAGGWQRGLRERQALGGSLASERGVPLRYLTNGEVTAYRDRIERNPADAVVLARAATQAIGSRGARDLLAEIGKDSEASTAIHVADLTIAGDRDFADQAAHGLTLKAAGQALSKDLAGDIEEALRPHRVALRNSPALSQAITNAAQAAALADDAAGRTRPARYYAQAALGRTTWQGRAYGGSAPVNGAAVIVPRWLNPDRFDDALSVLNDVWRERGIAPTYENGQAMPSRDVSRLRPALMPNGNYRLVDRNGRVAYGPNRRVFEVDLEAGREYIARRLGVEAVRPD